MTTGHTLNLRESDRLYDQYVKPIENRHRGEYVGVSFDGDTVIGSTLVGVIQQSSARFGKGKSVVFRVGDKVVGRIRTDLELAA